MIMNTRAASKRPLTDFHSHLLPAMDDGARDTDTALEMLRRSAQQGVDTVCATPHFYWGEDTVDTFLERRTAAVERLSPHLTEELPALRLGAEVLVREGISRLDLRPLCLEGTSVLLVELPFMRAPYWLVEELESVVYDQSLTLMLAHLDRYMPWYSAKSLEPLLDLPDTIVQLNSESLTDRRALRGLVKWLPEHPRLVLGSDMHDLRHRAPDWERMVQTLSRHRTGRDWLARAEATADEINDPILL